MARVGSLDILPRRAGKGAKADAGGGREGASIFKPGKNVWRTERAGRAAVLIDGAAFFRALRASLIKAERSVFIVGWDIDSRLRLVGEDCKADDGFPVTFADFLSALVRERPELTINLLLWDYSVVYALERELFPTLSLQWSTPNQVQLCLDDNLPVGSSHHQKIIVVDDAVAFCGGLDLAIRRWDTPDHSLDNPDRVDPAGKPYRPFHDVQMMVDGEAARALGELARARWTRATCEAPAKAETPAVDPWPQSVTPDFRDVAVGIARTVPLFEEQEEVREVEALFGDMIGAARQSIYIENQFLTCTTIAARLAEALRANPALEVLIVGPRNYHSWIEGQTMRPGRVCFMNMLDAAGVAERVRLLYPDVRQGGQTADTMLHSKVLIIDDRLLRIGSANLNNRSMGADTECDLVLEADGPAQRAGIVGVRNRLIGEHCGTSGGAIARAFGRTGSLIAAAESVSHDGHSLRRIEDGEANSSEIASAISEIADPSRPLPVELSARKDDPLFSRISIPTMVRIVLAALVLLSLPFIWRYTPLATYADPDTVRGAMAAIADNAWAPAIVVAVFVAGGLVAFPVMVLIAVTAASFGPVLGFTYAGAGALTSAMVTYGVGAWLGKDLLRSILGPRLDRIRRRIVKQGVLAVAGIRLVPVAPFTFVNLVAGASEIRLYDYLAGTILGMAPGLVIMSALGHQVFQILSRPTAGNIAALGGAVVAWIAVSVGVQLAMSRFGKA